MRAILCHCPTMPGKLLCLTVSDRGKQRIMLGCLLQAAQNTQSEARAQHSERLRMDALRLRWPDHTRAIRVKLGNQYTVTATTLQQLGQTLHSACTR